MFGRDKKSSDSDQSSREQDSKKEGQEVSEAAVLLQEIVDNPNSNTRNGVNGMIRLDEHTFVPEDPSDLGLIQAMDNCHLYDTTLPSTRYLTYLPDGRRFVARGGVIKVENPPEEVKA